MREPPKIPVEYLRICLQDQYDLIPVTLDFLPLGLDFSAGVYRVVSEQGTPFLLKVTSRPLYEPKGLVPRYLNDQGITAVVAPVPTKNQSLWTRLVDWTVMVYPFIEGETSWTGITDKQWKEVGMLFQRIHQVRLPSLGFESLRKENFDPTAYAQRIRSFETQHTAIQASSSVPHHFLRSSWKTHQSTIQSVVAMLETLGSVLQRRTQSYQNAIFKRFRIRWFKPYILRVLKF